MSAVSEIAIWNLALSHVASGDEVQDIAENSAGANACRRFYDQARQEVLSDFPWPFATTTIALSVVANNPTTEWAFSYRYPSNCLTLQRLLGAVRNESRATRVPYRIQRDSQGPVLFTDWPNAQAQFTVDVTDTTQFSATFAQALAFLLASYIAPRVTGGDPYNLGTRALKLYQWAMMRAQNNAANEEQPEAPPESEFILAREGGLTSATVFDQPGPFQ